MTRLIILIAVLGMAGCSAQATPQQKTSDPPRVACSFLVGCIYRIRIEQDKVTCYGSQRGLSCLKDTDQSNGIRCTGSKLRHRVLVLRTDADS